MYRFNQQLNAGRTNQVTPWGSTTWSLNQAPRYDQIGGQPAQGGGNLHPIGNLTGLIGNIFNNAGYSVPGQPAPRRAGFNDGAPLRGAVAQGGGQPMAPKYGSAQPGGSGGDPFSMAMQAYAGQGQAPSNGRAYAQIGNGRGGAPQMTGGKGMPLAPKNGAGRQSVTLPDGSIDYGGDNGITNPGNPDPAPGNGSHQPTPNPGSGGNGNSDQREENQWEAARPPADVNRDIWTQTTTLSPEQQAIFDQQQNNQYGRGQLIGASQQQVADQMGRPLDTSGLRGWGQIGANAGGNLGNINARQYSREAADASYRQATRYLNPQMQQQSQALQQRLAEQGFVPGTPAYQQAMSGMLSTQDQALADARDRSISTGNQVGQNWANFDLQRQGQGFQQDSVRAGFNNQTRQQQLAELLTQRQLPFNELASLSSGQAMNGPQMGGMGGGGGGGGGMPSMGGLDIMGMAGQDAQNRMAGYNANVAQSNSNTQAAAGVAGAGLAATASMWGPWLAALL